MFNFEDDSKPENTVNAGLILGFITLDTPGFPSPNNNQSYPDGVPTTTVDKTSYVVARCCPTYHNFDKKMITEVKLISGEQSVYIIPMDKLVGPVATVPNIFTEYRMHGDEETWLAVKPYRKWGRHFGDTIKWTE